MAAREEELLEPPSAAGAYYNLSGGGAWRLEPDGDVNFFAAGEAPPAECLGDDGTVHAAIRVVGARRLVVDLRGRRLALSPVAASRHRRCSLLVLQSCTAVRVLSGELDRATEACLALQDCSDVVISDVTVGNFELAGISVERCRGVVIERVAVAGHYGGARPSPAASVLASYLPLLRSLPAGRPLLAFCEQQLEQQRTSGPGEQCGCFGVLGIASSGVRVRQLSVSGPIAWAPPQWLLRSVAISGAPPPSVVTLGSLCPCQGLYGDLCPVQPFFLSTFLTALQHLLPPDLARRLVFVGPAAASRSVDAGGFSLNCSRSEQGFERTALGSAVAAPSQPRWVLQGLDLWGRRMRGAAAVWLERCPDALVESLEPPGAAAVEERVRASPPAPQASVLRADSERQLRLEAVSGYAHAGLVPRPLAAPLVRWGTDLPSVGTENEPEARAVLVQSLRARDVVAPQPAVYVLPPPRRTPLLSSARLLGGSNFLSFPPPQQA
jgi:hypothetical protein